MSVTEFNLPSFQKFKTKYVICNKKKQNMTWAINSITTECERAKKIYWFRINCFTSSANMSFGKRRTQAKNFF